MNLSFQGGAGTVTGSKTWLSDGQTDVLVDCGLFQGLKDLRLRNWAEPSYPIPQAIILTHAHLDHSGFIPRLVAKGFKGPIYCTPATFDLCKILLPDSARIQEEDAEHANVLGFSKHHPALPLYTEADALRSLSYFKPIDFNTPFAVGTLTASFYHAGHILGAASVHIRSSASGQRVLFSGDLGRPSDLILKGPSTDIPQADTVVMEATYGDREHPKEDLLTQLERTVRATLDAGHIVLAPAFAVGRAQSLTYAFHTLMAQGRLPTVPIYVDSPMATDVTELLSSYPDELCLSPKVWHQAFSSAIYVRSATQSKQLNGVDGPFVIISASGMLTGGRVLHHLMKRGHVKDNLVLLAGFQAPATRGRDLLEGQRQLKIHGKSVFIRAEVAQLAGYSAHADQGELLTWLGSLKRPSRVILNHGEPGGLEALKIKIESRYGLATEIARPS